MERLEKQKEEVVSLYTEGKKPEAANGSICMDQLRELLERYAIGKKPLSKLLGWGETTVLRYLDGEIPSKEYSERLRILAEHPEIYLQVLESGKERITKVAYRKSRQAVEALLFGSRLDIVAYMVRKEMKDEHGAQALQYYCYYAQVLSMYLYGKELFDEDYQTEENLKPYPGIVSKDWNQGMCDPDFENMILHTADAAFSTDEEAKREQMLIREVVFAFRWYGLETIKSMISHERNFLKITYPEHGKPMITKETLKQYFKKQFDELKIEQPKDFHKYVSSLAFKLIRE